MRIDREAARVSWISRAPRVRTADVLALANLPGFDAGTLERALRLSGCSPDASGWRTRVDRLLLGVAVALALFGVICIVAYNWSAIGRWGKFAAAQALIAVVFAAALLRGLDALSGKTLLTCAIGLIGPLLALFGQTYQTGADVHGLFFTWAALALPWTLAARFAPAWLLWIGIVETGAALYLTSFARWDEHFFGVLPAPIAGCLANGVLLAVWEWAAHRLAWLSGRLGPRLIATLLLTALTGLACLFVFVPGEYTARLGCALWAIAMIVGHVCYRRIAIELWMLAIGCMSLTAVALAVLIRVVDATNTEVFGFFLGAGVLIGASALTRTWLRDCARQVDR